MAMLLDTWFCSPWSLHCPPGFLINNPEVLVKGAEDMPGEMT